MENIQHVSHDHLLVFNEARSNESEEKPYCYLCEEVVSGPTYSCMACGFHLHKNCVEAPLKMNHPLHRKHSLQLKISPVNYNWVICDFCNKRCGKTIYFCSCELRLHFKCALFSYNVAEKNIGKLQHFACEDLLALIPAEKHPEKLKSLFCFVCWIPLSDSAYLSLDCGFCLHKKCVEMPFEIDHLCHHQHALVLQFNCDRLPCKMCQGTQLRGFVYSCSMCKVALHIDCVLPSPIIQDSSHEHSFTRFFRQFSFICDACGTPGNNVYYICSTCSLIVHKDCISLPRIIKSGWHSHPIFHKYCVAKIECGIMECEICQEEVNKEYGSYSCFECKFIVHVKCVLEGLRYYYEIEPKDAYEELNENRMVVDPSFLVIKVKKLGENVIYIEIKHFSHDHNLVLNNEVKDEKCCDCCSLLIETSFYHCSACDFCLHKPCAELPRKKQVWGFPFSLDLIPNVIFRCYLCCRLCNGFAYNYNKDTWLDVQCAELSLSCTSQGHREHPLHLYANYKGQCNACGCSFTDHWGAWAYRCKVCNIYVHGICSQLPHTAQHKCDEHHLTLSSQEDNDYAEYHYCDICEEKRNPNIWFYHCAICDKSAHVLCVLQDYTFFKLGKRIIIERDHPHALTFVKMVYLYPKCSICGQPCLELALECAETRCNFIIHVRCSYLIKIFFG